MLHMNRSVAGNGKTPEEQSRNGRYELLERDFTVFEKDIREHLSGMLSETEFDPGRDIAGITVNRWPHGYAWMPNPIFNGEYKEGEARRMKLADSLLVEFTLQIRMPARELIWIAQSMKHIGQ